ncbi:hypothetical protein [Algoriphagus namhaensis]
MKKTMMMTLAVLGMVLGSFAVVQPVKAQDTVYYDCTYIEDDFGCTVADCGDCVGWACSDPSQCGDGDCDKVMKFGC